MKTIRKIAAFLMLAACFVWVMASCTTTTVTTVTSDKNGTVTETTTVTKSADAAAVQLAGLALTAYAPRAHVVRYEKSASDMQRILKGRRVTKEEIALRWKPLPKP